MPSLRESFKSAARNTLTVGLILALSPIFAGAAIASYLSIGESPIYTQKRLGLNEKPFNIIKFRSMRSSPFGQHAQRDDHKYVTKTGQFLRKYKIDEMPQLINIIKGDMNFIGPRPVLYRMPQHLSEVYNYKPGLFSPKNITKYRRISPDQVDFTERVNKGHQIEIDKMKSMLEGLKNSRYVIYNNMREHQHKTVNQSQGVTKKILQLP